MSDTVIRVENLSKRYMIGRKETLSRSLQDSLITWLNRGFNWLSSYASVAKFENEDGGEEEFWALKDVSFEVKKGECLGIIGRNGAGKSTLLKILSRITEPTDGRICIRGRVASLLEVGTGFHPELTGRENIFLNGTILGMARNEIERKFDDIVAFAEIEKFLDTPVKRYSSGMYVRLAFSVAAHLDPEILIIDEVLAVGDTQFQKKCLGKMGKVARQGRTVLFVSHNMPAITQLCDKAILLERGAVQETGLAKNTVGSYLGGIQALNPSATFPIKSGAPLQFVAISVKDFSGKVSSVFSDAQGFALELDVAVNEVVTNVYFGLILANSEGLKILFADSRDRANMNLEKLLPGMYRYSLKFPPIFIPDKYTVTLGIANSVTLRQIDYIESACCFELVQSENIQRTSERTGIINLRLAWNQEIV